MVVSTERWYKAKRSEADECRSTVSFVFSNCRIVSFSKKLSKKQVFRMLLE